MHLDISDGLRYKEVVEITKHDMEFSSTSPPISRKGQILCMIITMPDNLDTKAVHVKNTWGKRCDILLFMSSVRNDSFPTIGINVTEGRNHLVSKVIQGFHYIADNYLDTADWFLKADDDTYVITENLRHFLSKENSDTSILFGQKFLHYHENHTEEYFTGGPGYVLSKAALKLFAEATQNCRTTCGPQDGTTEDVKFTIYMHQLGAELGNSLDSLGRSRFHSFRFEEFLTRKQPNRIIERQFQGGEVVSILRSITKSKTCPCNIHVLHCFHL